MTQAEAHMDVLHDRPEGEIPNGLRQEAKDPYTRVGNQIIDVCLALTSAYMGLGLEGAGWLEGRGDTSNDPQGRDCLKVNEHPPVLGVICLASSPYQAPLDPSEVPERMAGEEDVLTNATEALKLSHPHLGPHHCFQPPQAWLLSRRKKDNLCQN